MNSNYAPLVRPFTDEEEEEEDTDSFGSSSHRDNDEVQYHFDGFEVEINVKKALTPVNVKA